MVCGTDRAVEQAKKLGHPPDKIFQTSGMILNPRFYGYRAWTARRAREVGAAIPDADRPRPVRRRRFGKMLEIGDRGRVRAADFHLRKNEKLAAALRSQLSPLRRFVEGFTTEIPYYMQLPISS